MAQLFSLATRKVTDTNIQVVNVNQVIQLEGYSYSKYVVYKIEQLKYNGGLLYKLINLKTYEYSSADIIRPLSQKFGIGFYYDDTNPQFIDQFEMLTVIAKAEEKEKADNEAKEKERQQINEVKTIGRERLKNLIPVSAKAMIVGRLHEDKSDSQTDYFGFNIARTIILGFSEHTKNLLSEMRKYAANFEGTAYLAENNPDYEHRENYKIGHGYYLGANYYSGWVIKKISIYNLERFIEEYAYTAGSEENICIKSVASQSVTDTLIAPVSGDYEIIDYSEKAFAVFGDTKAIAKQLNALGGRYNKYLKYKEEKKAGWIFSKSKLEAVSSLLGMN